MVFLSSPASCNTSAPLCGGICLKCAVFPPEMHIPVRRRSAQNDSLPLRPFLHDKIIHRTSMCDASAICKIGRSCVRKPTYFSVAEARRRQRIRPQRRTYLFYLQGWLYTNQRRFFFCLQVRRQQHISVLLASSKAAMCSSVVGRNVRSARHFPTSSMRTSRHRYAPCLGQQMVP